MTIRITLKGGPGSGNHGHSGRPGMVGGSGGGGGVNGIDSVINKGMVDDAIAYATSMLEGESMDAAVDNLREYVAANPASIMVPPSVAIQVLADGRYKNQHEIESSEALYNPELFAKHQKKVFNVGDGTPEDYPIYGYISDAQDSRVSSAQIFAIRSAAALRGLDVEEDDKAWNVYEGR